MVVLWFLLGGAAEWVNMLLRRWTVERVHRLKPVWVVFVVALGFVSRLAWMALILGLAMAWDSAYGIAAFAGYWLSRWLLIGRVMRKVM